MEIKPTDNEQERVTNTNRGYLRVIGAIMHAMVFTRPDIAFHTSRLASCMQAPSNAAYEACLGVIHYLYHTKELGITFGKVRDLTDPDDIEPDYDGSYVRAHGDGTFNGRGEHSPYGGGFTEFYFGLLTWIARSMKFKPLSSCEMEVAAMVAVTKEGVFSTNILLDMHAELTKVLKVLTDSQSGRDVVCNAGATKHTVHFERWLYYVRDMYLRKKLMIELVTTVKMRADDKTKV